MDISSNIHSPNFADPGRAMGKSSRKPPSSQPLPKQLPSLPLLENWATRHTAGQATQRPSYALYPTYFTSSPYHTFLYVLKHARSREAPQHSPGCSACKETTELPAHQHHTGFACAWIWPVTLQLCNSIT